MIKGKTKEEVTYVNKPVVNYRKIDALNQSMLKLFDTDPVKFFEEFKLGKKRKDSKKTAMIIGDLVDFHLLECAGDEEVFENRFDEKFALFTGVKGSGQVFTLADYLFEATEASLNEKNEVTSSFDERFKEAYFKVQAEGKYKGKALDKVLEDFEANGKDYFKTLLENIGKCVVDISLVDKAKIVANNLLTDPFTREIFQENDKIEIVTHFPIEWKFKIGDKLVNCKAELDRMAIDHDKKTIQIDDLKTTYDNESFDYMYMKNSYYLQASFYYMAVVWWALENGLSGYEILPPRFIVGDTSSNNRRPLIYQISKEDVNAGFKGFTMRGIRYRGVDELMNDIQWAEDNDMWTCSREAFNNSGQMKLNIQYDKVKVTRKRKPKE